MTTRPSPVAAPLRHLTAAARSERARARPAEILDAARDLFSRKGFEAARMDEVAAAAGVTKPAVYRYQTTNGALAAGGRALIRGSMGLGCGCGSNHQQFSAQAARALEGFEDGN